jgi:hypothetical protein
MQPPTQERPEPLVVLRVDLSQQLSRCAIELRLAVLHQGSLPGTAKRRQALHGAPAQQAAGKSVPRDREAKVGHRLDPVGGRRVEPQEAEDRSHRSANVGDELLEEEDEHVVEELQIRPDLLGVVTATDVGWRNNGEIGGLRQFCFDRV